jgi:hypothetical protein
MSVCIVHQCCDGEGGKLTASTTASLPTPAYATNTTLKTMQEMAMALIKMMLFRKFAPPSLFLFSRVPASSSAASHDPYTIPEQVAQEVQCKSLESESKLLSS